MSKITKSFQNFSHLFFPGSNLRPQREIVLSGLPEIKNCLAHSFDQYPEKRGFCNRKGAFFKYY